VAAAPAARLAARGRGPPCLGHPREREREVWRILREGERGRERFGGENKFISPTILL